MAPRAICWRGLCRRRFRRTRPGRRITDPNAGPLFSGEAGEGDLESGTIYVLRSLSDHPEIVSRRTIVHKIGVTGSDPQNPHRQRAQMKQLSCLPKSRSRPPIGCSTSTARSSKTSSIEHLLPARLDLSAGDRFGKSVQPREWFLVPLSAIDRLVSMIMDGSVTTYLYDLEQARFVKA